MIVIVLSFGGGGVLMRPSLFNNNPTRGTDTSYQQIEIEDELRRENEALLNSLSDSVIRMKSVAGGLGREVNEQNQVIRALSQAFSSAQGGVGSSITHLRNVVDRYGWRATIYFSLMVLFILYIFSKIVL